MLTFFPNTLWALPASSATPSNLQWACQPLGPPNVLQNANNTYMGSDGTITLPSTNYYDIVVNYSQAEFGYTGTAAGSFLITYYPPNTTTGCLVVTCPIIGTAGSTLSAWNRNYLQQGGTIKVSVNMPVAYSVNFTTPCIANYVSLVRKLDSDSVMTNMYCQAGGIPQCIKNGIRLYTWATVSGFKATFPLTIDGTTTGRPIFSSIIQPQVTVVLPNAGTSPINAASLSVDPYSSTNPQSISVTVGVGTNIATVLVNAAPTQIAPPAGTIVTLHVIGIPN